MSVQGLAGASKSTCAMDHVSGERFKAVSEHCQGGVAKVGKAAGHTGEALHPGIDAQCEHLHYSEDAHQKHLTCSACSDCYAGACAPPSYGPIPPMIAPFNHLYLFISSPFTGFIPAGLERPPRANALG